MFSATTQVYIGASIVNNKRGIDMEDKSLLKAALVCSMVGVTALFFISEFMDVEESGIGDIGINNVDNNVKVIGTVSNVVDTETTMVMDVLQSQEIKVVVFKEEDFKLKRGDFVEVLGKVQDNNGKLEIIGDRIRSIS